MLARPHGQRRYEAGHRTVALVGLWRRDDDRGRSDDPTHTLLESYADGWAWSIPIDADAPRRRRDGRPEDHGAGQGATAPRASIARRLPRPVHLAGLVGGAALAGGPWGWDASMYCAERPAGDDLAAGRATPRRSSTRCRRPG